MSLVALVGGCQAGPANRPPAAATDRVADGDGDVSRPRDGGTSDVAISSPSNDARSEIAPAPADGPTGEVAAGSVDGAEASPASPLDDMGTIELVHDGFQFVEGARWVPALSALLVSDPFASTIYQLIAPNELDVYRSMSNGANALDVAPDGHLVTAEIKGAVTRQAASGSWADAIESYAGLELSSPNDLAAVPDGSIFFSDLGAPRALFRIDPAGTLSYAVPAGDTATGINGITLSPRKDVLYVGYMAARLVRAFEVGPDGLTGARTVVPLTDPNPDGMCVDVDGNLYVGTQRGVQVFDPRSGRYWGLIALPGLGAGDRASECAFADADARTLHISAVTKLFRVRLAHPGVY